MRKGLSCSLEIIREGKKCQGKLVPMTMGSRKTMPDCKEANFEKLICRQFTAGTGAGASEVSLTQINM